MMQGPRGSSFGAPGNPGPPTFGVTRRAFVRGMTGLSVALTCSAVLGGCEIINGPSHRRVRRVGYLFTDAEDSSHVYTEIVRALDKLGWVEDQNIVFEWRFTDGDAENYPQLAAELAGLGVDLIVTGDIVGSRAAKHATATIPIVFNTSTRPVENGLVASYSRPGANVTGVTGDLPGISGKRLELLKQVVPGARRVAAIRSPDPTRMTFWDETRVAAQRLGVQVRSIEVTSREDFDAACAAMLEERPDVLLGLPNPLVLANRQQFLQFTIRERLPSMWFWPQFVEDGGLMAYSPNLLDIARKVAGYVDRILRGANPAELPVEQPTEIDFVFNLSTARLLGLAIPPEIAVQVTEWVQ